MSDTASVILIWLGWIFGFVGMCLLEEWANKRKVSRQSSHSKGSKT